ncbi:MAG TPA: TerB family tellurite resistance protein [Rhizobiaceae bacterium]
MFDRIISFLKDLPSGDVGRRKLSGADDPKVAAAALMYHVMDADGVRQDAEWEQMKQLLRQSYGLSGEALDQLVAAGGKADEEAVDLYAFTSVLKRHLDEQARIEFIGLLWQIVFADGELHELEDNMVWRIAELVGVERRDRVLQRQKAQAAAPGATGKPADD